MTNKDVIVFSVLIVAIMFLFGGVIGMNYWDAEQVRVMYSNTYQKNLDCRTSMKSSTASRIAEVCGHIPQFKDYQND